MIGHREQLHQVKPKSPASDLASIECQPPHIVAIRTLCGWIRRLILSERIRVAVHSDVLAGIYSSAARADKLQSYRTRISAFHPEVIGIGILVHGHAVVSRIGKSYEASCSRGHRDFH